MRVLAFLFSFRGRLARRGFWLRMAVAVCLYLAATIGFALAISAWFTSTTMPRDPAFFWFVRTVPIAVALLVFVLVLAAIVRRLHDRDRSGLWSLAYIFGPFLLSIASDLSRFFGEGRPVFDPGNRTIGLAAFVIAGFALVDLGLVRGTRDANRFGLDPLAPDDGMGDVDAFD